ncbi:hypothetical protein AVEN_248082-1 [Araneus ventricosus]|uniref:Uncharacterized protein n=1 Tax=Araneus ventricosus TaxID=182803 RepID=A0A4Y2MPF6_ARAVE|nr:hypothetical protein AVEN_248082-1 [Araneus ventricosus]
MCYRHSVLDRSASAPPLLGESDPAPGIIAPAHGRFSLSGHDREEDESQIMQSLLQSMLQVRPNFSHARLSAPITMHYRMEVQLQVQAHLWGHIYRQALGPSFRKSHPICITVFW